MVQFDVNVPDEAPRTGLEARESAEAGTAAKLAQEEPLVRSWKPPVAPGETKAHGL